MLCNEMISTDDKGERIGIVGSGPTGIYVLQRLLTTMPERQRPIGSIQVFERKDGAGIGMPHLLCGRY